jgi:hypothetical protein
MNTHCQLLDDVQEDLLNDDIMKSREGLFFLANRSSTFLRNRNKSYFCQFSQEKILFAYAEIEKIRGKHLSLQETLKLKKVLFNNIGETIETIYSDLFIPTNEEEIYKHIATLSHGVSSLSSLPHIMISFVKQNHDVLFF